MIDKLYLEKVQTDAIKRYNERYEKIGVSPKTLGWGSLEHQLERFRTINKNCDLNRKTIIDLGCGFGDLYRYLKEKNIDVEYIGIDINSHFIDFCKKNYPEQKFYCKNIMIEDVDIVADVVISLGTLNFKLEDDLNYEYSKIFMEKAFNMSRDKIIVDFLSDRITSSYPREDFVFYHSPQKIFDYAMNLSENVLLIHNYKPIPQKEFMIIIEK